MNRRMLRRLATIAGSGLMTMVLGCGDVSHNDFGQSLSFRGFYEGGACTSALSGLIVSTALVTDEVTPCTLGQLCTVNVQVTNETTGNPIPSTGGQGSTGSPVPTTDGVRILPRNLHVEYSLPAGEIPSRDWVMSGAVDPLDSDCREFPLLLGDDTIAITQDPLSYPTLPFPVRARVTWEGVTEGGLSIKTHGDLDFIID